MPTKSETEKPQTWHRRKAETENAFSAFCAYREAGAGRSIVKTAKAIGRSHTWISTLASKHDWTDRVRDFDSHNQAVMDTARENTITEVYSRWEQRRLSECEDTFALAILLRDKARAMLRFPLQTSETTKSKGPDGKTIETTIIEPARWTFGTASTIARISAELAAQAIEEALAEDLSFDPSTASIEELRTYVERSQARWKARRDAMTSAGKSASESGKT